MPDPWRPPAADQTPSGPPPTVQPPSGPLPSDGPVQDSMSGSVGGSVDDPADGSLEGLAPPADQLVLDRQMLAEPTRQAPAAVVFIAWRFIKNLGAVNIGIALLFLASGRLSGVLLGVGSGAAVIGLVFMTLAWWRFVFSVDGDELLVTKGVIAEERLTIPLDRVQSVAINQKFLHRIIGLVSASVDTAGSSSAEFEIDAVDRSKAEALQRLVAGHRRSAAAAVVADGSQPDGAVAAPVEEFDVVRRTLPDLVRIGVSRWPWAGLVALAPLLAIADDLSGVLPVDLPDEGLVQDNLPADFGARLVATLLAIFLIGVVVISIFGALLQVIREVVTNWDMRLIRTATGLRRTAGLLSKTSKASTLSRIQAVQTDQTPVQRLFGIRKLTLPTVGEGDIGVPGASEDELSTVRRIVFGQDTPPQLDRMISRLAVFLAVRNRVLIIIPAVIVVFLRVRWWALLLLVFIPLEWLLSRRRWRLRRWSISEWRIAESYELVNKHTAELDLIKSQTVSVNRSFFERRRGLATVKIETAEGHIAVPLITLAEAEAVRDRVLFTVESDRRSFM